MFEIKRIRIIIHTLFDHQDLSLLQFVSILSPFSSKFLQHLLDYHLVVLEYISNCMEQEASRNRSREVDNIWRAVGGGNR